MSLEEKYISIMEKEEEEKAEKEEEEDMQEAAASVVGGAIHDAVDKIIALKKEEAGAVYKMRNIAWMRCTDFSIGRGLLQIEDYMKTWELHESWLHWSNYLNSEELQYSTRYYYRVRWSIPTCRKPIPRATACVYFVIEISKIKPKSLPVEVFFVVETNKLIHRPGKTRFKEKWLKDVIESKIVMMETVDF